MKNILKMFAVLTVMGMTTAVFASLVDIPLDAQINIGRETAQSPSGDAIYWPIAPYYGTFMSDEPEGYARTNMPQSGWYYGPYVDFYLAGLTDDWLDLSAGGTIEFDCRYFQGGENPNPYADAPIFVRIYTYTDDGDPGNGSFESYAGHRDYGIVYATQNGDPPYPTWTHVSVDISGGTDGNAFDISKVSRLRFYGTDWTGAGQDFIDVKNLQITLVPEPGTIAMFALGLLGLFVTRRKK